MITKELALRVISILQSISQEPAIAVRRGLLHKYALQAKPNGESELINLIISFQLSEIFDAYLPKFNTLEFTSLYDDIATWFNSTQSKSEFHALPYISQYFIYYMSSVSKLRLVTKDISTIEFKYIDPYKWLSFNTKPEMLETDKCSFCGINEKVEDNLCGVCKANLTAWTDYRNADFEVVMVHQLCTWTPLPSRNFGDFDFIFNNYKITRSGDGNINYQIVSNLAEPYDQQLPFTEYQRDT